VCLPEGYDAGSLTCPSLPTCQHFRQFPHRFWRFSQRGPRVLLPPAYFHWRPSSSRVFSYTFLMQAYRRENGIDRLLGSPFTPWLEKGRTEKALNGRSQASSTETYLKYGIVRTSMSQRCAKARKDRPAALAPPRGSWVQVRSEGGVLSVMSWQSSRRGTRLACTPSLLGRSAWNHHHYQRREHGSKNGECSSIR
jgi:hypothetical protein